MLTYLFHVSIIVFSLTLLYFQEQGLYVAAYSLFAALVGVCLWKSNEYRQFRSVNWCHPAPVFVAGFIIVYYQLPFCYLAGFELSAYSRKVLLFPQNISYCLLVASIGLSSFFCGYQFILKRKMKQGKHKIAPAKLESNMFRDQVNHINSIKPLVLILTLTIFSLYMSSLGLTSYFEYNYGRLSGKIDQSSIYLGFIATLLMYFFLLLELACVIYQRPDSLASYFRAWDKRALILMVIILLPSVLSGDRGAYLQPLALFVAPYFLLVTPLRLKSALVMFILLAFAMILVADTRGGRDVDLSKAIDSRIDTITNPAEWPTIELANSFGTFNIATEYFPDRYSYLNGKGTLFKLASIFPFSSKLTGIAQLNKDSNYIYTSSLFFTNILTDGTFSSGSGTSFLADTYMDFGPYGIPVVMFFFGIFLGWVSINAIISQSPIFVFLYSYYCFNGFYINRADLFSGWNILLWVILPYLIVRSYRLYKYSKIRQKGISL